MKSEQIEYVEDLDDLAKKALSFKERLKFSKIKDKKERSEAIKFVLYSKLELKYQDLLVRVSKLKKKENHFYDFEQYLSILLFKIKFFKLDPKKENFYNVLLLIKKIEEGLK